MALADALAWALAEAPGTRARVLAEAYASGARTVMVEGRRVEYATTAEMERALVALHIASSPGVARRPRMTLARVGDGFR